MAVYGNDIAAVVTACVLMSILASASAVNCYECNVWKAGYGYKCYEPRNKTNCVTCMKIETTIFMGFYKNTPRTSSIISRTCAQSKAVPHITGCYDYQMADGHNRRCYCNTDFCNAAPKQTVAALCTTLSTLFAAAFHAVIY